MLKRSSFSSAIHKTAPLSLQYDFEQTIGPLDNLQHPADIKHSSPLPLPQWLPQKYDLKAHTTLTYPLYLNISLEFGSWNVSSPMPLCSFSLLAHSQGATMWWLEVRSLSSFLIKNIDALNPVHQLQRHGAIQAADHNLLNT